ncbi:hypothetical protein [Capnocytophaga sp.]|uniref:hypothetical protein n=1 Tax=Capnocytophaga sp. TaxID=44737 RepID=UPI0026DCDE56|nr:hypothetical protein [Capnocytophaga sp.]MDO5104750.1 hypothetical protein [Capnocytophaga sp.]
MRPIFALLILFLGVSVQAQESVWNRLAVSTEYRYLGRNAAGLGFEYRIPHKDAMTCNVGVKAYYTSVEGKPKVVPQLNVEYGLFLVAGVSVTPYAVEPQLQFNVLNLFALNMGYAIPIDKNRYFRGITFGVQFNIAVGKDSKYYDRLRMIGF